MEHRLVQGGEQFLAFARSCVAKLKKLGLPYADQSYEIDGVSIKVRIEPGHEYIRIEGGSVRLEMDSGVVDVINIGSGNPLRYAAGTLIEAGDALSYNAPFVDSPLNTGRWNPGKTSLGQLAGIITKKSRFVGNIRPDAKSFEPVGLKDENLYAKKLISILCPASIFTGRCRRYVQAIYGSPLYAHDKNGVVTNLNMIPRLEASTEAAPALWIPAYKKIGDLTAYPDLLVDTSCGVILDVVDGTHWLAKPIGNELRIYPLRATSSVEKLRTFLRAENLSLSTEDKDHLESYILSCCLPDTASVQIALSGLSSVGRYSMGYGWHWNYSGSAADMVVNSREMQDTTHTGMVSTHFRCTVKKKMLPEPDGGFSPSDTRFVWQGTLVYVEGPVRWSVYRTYWTIVAPNYSSMVLDKITPQNTFVYPCSAPFYAFYLGDELQVCRVDVQLADGIPESIVYSNCSGDNCVTVGLNEGYRLVTSAVSAYHEAVFSCGGKNSVPLPYLKTKNWPSRVDVKNKVVGAWIAGFGSGAGGVRTFTVSDDYGTSYSSVTEWSNLIDDRQTRNITLDTSVSSGQDQSVGTASVVVPFYDSEAIYIQTETLNTSTTLTNITYHLAHNSAGPIGAFIVRSVTDVSPSLSYAAANGAFAADNLTLLGSESIIPSPTNTTTVDISNLFCSSGAITATFSHTAEFRDNAADSVGAEFGTISSKSVAIAPGFINAFGLNGASVTAPVIVGWV